MEEKTDYAIVFDELTKTYDSNRVLNCISFKVKKGSIFGLLGPNGSGKTTIINIVTGIINASSGRASINGVSIQESPIEVKRSIGVVLETPALFNMMTIWEHLLLTGPIYGLSIKETGERGRDLLNLLGLWESRNSYIDNSSYGMKKKVSIAMALIHSPSVIFLDEPFKGLDPISSKLLKELLKSISRKGVTVFMSTHITSKLEELIDEFAILSEGKIIHSQMIEKEVSEIDIEDVFFKFIKSPEISEIKWFK